MGKKKIASSADNRQTVFLEHFESIAKAGAWEIDLETNEVYWSRGVHHMLGINPDDFILNYDSAVAHIHPEDRQRSLDNFKNVIENKVPYDIQKRLLTTSGKDVFVRSRAEVIYDAEGKPERLVGIFSDISDLIEARKKYEDAQEATKSLIENLDGIFWEADAQTIQFSYVSPQSEAITGYAPEEWIDDPDFWEKHLHPEEREEIFSYCSAETKLMRDHTFDYRFRHKDGHYIWLHDRTKVVLKDGAPYKLTGMMVDISYEKELSQALEQESKLNEVLIKTLPSLFYLFDEEGNHLLWNEKLEEITGYTAEEIKKIKPLDMYEGEDRERIAKHIDIALREGFTQVEGQLITKSGKKVPLFFTAATTVYQGKKCIFGSGIDISAIREAELKLRQSEQKLQALVSEGSDMISIQNEKGEYLFISPNHERITGKPGHELIGAKPLDFIHSEDVERISADFRRAVEGERVKTDPYRIKTRTGKWVWLQSTATNLTHDPAIGGIVVKTTDITSLMLSRMEAEQKKQELQYILDYSLDVICTIDAEGNFISVSAASLQMWGYEPDELEGKSYIEFVCEEDRKKTLDVAGRIMSGEEYTNFENRYMHKNGSIVPVIWSAHWNKELNQMHCVGRDASAIKKAEQTIRESEARYRGLYESQTNFVIRTDIFGKFTYMNKKYARVMGLPSKVDELKNHNVMESICEYHHERVRKVVDDCIAEPGKVIKVTMDKYNSGKEVIHTTWDFVCIADQSGKPTELQCVGNDITEQIRFEQELLRSNERFEELNKASSESIYEFDPLSEEFFLGDGFERNFGISADDGFNQFANIFQLIHPDDRDRVRLSFTNCLENPDQYKFSTTYRFRKTNGEYARVTDRNVILRDEDGKPVRIIGSLQDVTTSYFFEKINEAETELLRKSMKQDVDIVEVLSEYLLQLEDLYPGMKASIMRLEQGKWLYPEVAPSLPAAYIEYLYGFEIGDNRGSCGTAAFKGETIISGDVLNDPKWKDFLDAAERFDIRACWSKPVFDSGGEVTATLAFYYVTPRKPNELELYGIDRAEKLIAIVLAKFRYLKRIQESNERFEIVSRATKDAIWDNDFENSKLYWGDGFKTLFGHETGLVNPDFDYVLKLIHPDDRDRIAKRAFEMVSGKDDSLLWDEEFRFMRADGSYAFVNDRAVFLRAEKGQNGNNSKAVRAIGAMTDISHRKQYEESQKKLNEELARNVKELALSNEELEQFAYVASHDLQEPLRMVDSFLTLLQKRYGDRLDNKAHQYIYFATDGAKRMRQIILDLLEYSRIGKYEKQVDKVSLTEVVDEAISLYRRKVDEKKAVIKYDNLPAIPSFRAPLLQIIQNLISNALKYSRPDIPLEISITAQKNDDKWIIAVKDNGIGIEEEYQDKIFVIFQRLHGKNEYEGTGIGLSMVKKIAETLGGSVWVESVPGEGSTFYVSIKEEVTA
ncbi:MAG: PAS domain-containing protein [Balneolia bacterium]|nr:PAS domain-containing protein [Balneolia bacterium]